jgi:serine O-acetyltransferase
MKMLEAMRQDSRYAHELRYRGRPPTLLTRARVLFSRGVFVMTVQRLTHEAHRRRVDGTGSGAVTSLLNAVGFVGWYVTSLVARCQLAGRTEFEEGVHVSDLGHVVMGARTVGTGTLIHHNVTIGVHPIDRGLPEIGRQVWIGPGSLIYGQLRIGDGATILPGTVLSKSVPDRAVVQGNPARVVRRGFDNAALLRTLSTDVGPLIAEPPRER